MLYGLLILLVVLAVLGLPRWPWSRTWGFYPSGALGLLLLVIVIVVLTGGNPKSGSLNGRLDAHGCGLSW